MNAPFWGGMIFTVYKNSYKDRVDKFNPCIYGKSAILVSNAVSGRLSKHEPTTSVLY